MKQIIHVNQHVIKENRKNNTCKPVLTVKTYKDNQYTNTATLKVDGRVVGKFVYRPEKPLSCGAHVWFESDTSKLTIELEDNNV